MKEQFGQIDKYIYSWHLRQVELNRKEKERKREREREAERVNLFHALDTPVDISAGKLLMAPADKGIKILNNQIKPFHLNYTCLGITVTLKEFKVLSSPV